MCAIHSATFADLVPLALPQTACSDLNKLPITSIDPKAVALANLYPAPNSGLSVYQASPALFEHANQFDTREDFNPNDTNQIFGRFSYSDDPQFIPGPFQGRSRWRRLSAGYPDREIGADGGGIHACIQPERREPGSGRLCTSAHHTRRTGFLLRSGIPAQYGIQGIPQFTGNGGLPGIVITNLQTLGSNEYLPSDEATATLQVTDDFTPDLRQAQLQDGPRVPEREVLHLAACGFAWPLPIQRYLH